MLKYHERHLEEIRRTGRRVASGKAVRSGSTCGESGGMCAGRAGLIREFQCLANILSSLTAPSSFLSYTRNPTVVVENQASMLGFHIRW